MNLIKNGYCIFENGAQQNRLSMELRSVFLHALSVSSSVPIYFSVQSAVLFMINYIRIMLRCIKIWMKI